MGESDEPKSRSWNILDKISASDYMNIVSSKNRIFYYDALRAFAIITIIACHVSGAFNFDYIFNHSELPVLYFNCISFFNHSSQIGVPIFVMLSGALLIGRGDTLKKFLKKRVERVVIPFLFWVFILILVEIIFFNNFGLNYFLDIFLAKLKTHGHVFWFVWMIIVIYCLIFIFNKLLSLLDSKNKKYLINISVALFVVYCFLVTFHLWDANQNRIVYYVSFFGYAVLGYWLVNRDFLNIKFLNFKISPTIMSILSFLISFGLYTYYISIICLPMAIEQNRFAGTSIFDIIALIIALFVFLFFRYIDEIDYRRFSERFRHSKLAKLIYSLSIHSYGIYFCHYIIIVVFGTIVLHPMGLFFKNPLKIIPFLTIFYLLVSWFIVYLLGKIPYLKMLCGKG